LGEGEKVRKKELTQGGKGKIQKSKKNQQRRRRKIEIGRTGGAASKKKEKVSNELQNYQEGRKGLGNCPLW